MTPLLTAGAGLVAASLLKASLLLGAALGVAWVARRRSAATRHAIWAAALGGALALPALAALLPPLYAPESLGAEWSRGYEWLAGRARRLVIAEAHDPRLARSRTSAGVSPSAPARAPDTGFADADGLEPTRGAGNPRAALAALGVLVWLAGALVLVVRLTFAHARAARIVRRSTPVASPHVARLTRELARAAGLRGPVRVLASREVIAPAVVGVVRPVVLVPVGAERWPADDARAVLAHEIAHVARRDGLADLVARVACDDRALAAGTPPERYAELLLAVARRARAGTALPAGALAMARPSELEIRLRAVLDPNVVRDHLPRRLVAAVALAAGGVIVPTAALRVDASPAVPPGGRAATVVNGVVPAHGGPTSARLVDTVGGRSAPGRLTRVVPRWTVAVPPLAQGAAAAASQHAPHPPRRGRAALRPLEPDQRRDSVSAPDSERVPSVAAGAVAPLEVLASGPDAVLAADLAASARGARGGPAPGARRVGPASSSPSGPGGRSRERAAAGSSSRSSTRSATATGACARTPRGRWARRARSPRATRAPSWRSSGSSRTPCGGCARWPHTRCAQSATRAPSPR